MTLSGRIAALHRHPIKGFTPEPLAVAELSPEAGVRHDRVYAVENGPSGFDPLAPGHISKMRFVALAPTPRAAKVRTALDDATGVITMTAPGMAPLRVDLSQSTDRRRFEAWLTDILGDEVNGPLKVVDAPGHRFLDDPAGQISLTSLSSLDALGRSLGRPVDPLRLRANIQVQGWPPFAELDLAAGAVVRIGAATARVVKPIRRCIATHVNPDTAERDMDLVGALQALIGRPDCGVYVQIVDGAEVRTGDVIEVA